MASRRETSRAISEDALADLPGPSRPRAALRWLPLAAILLTLALLYAFGLQDFLSLDALRRSRGQLDAFVDAHPLGAAAAYLLVYVAIVAISFPGAGFLTIAGGLLFGAALGTLLAALAATIGATLVFLFARTSLGDVLARFAGARGERLRLGFQRDGFNYLLFLRLVPLFPFWLVNLAAALFGMRLIPYVVATAAGILPMTLVFAWFGAGLGTTLRAEQPASLQLFAALLLLGVMALMPAVVRRWRRKGAGSEEPGRRAKR